MENSRSFKSGEKVLAEDGELLYEAKILKVHPNGLSVYVHYHGWKASYDRWILLDNVMKYTEANRKRKRDLERTIQQIKSNKKVKISETGAKEKAKDAYSEKDKPKSSSEKMAKITLPNSLRKQLLFDWHRLFNLNKSVKLPRSPCVAEVLRKYEESKSNRIKRPRLAHSVRVLRACFDKGMPKMLHYNERQQYEQEVMANGATPSSLYGAEHLLRVFHILPHWLKKEGIKESTALEIQQHAEDLIKFIKVHESSFFPTPYHDIILTYQRREPSMSKRKMITYQRREKKAKI